MRTDACIDIHTHVLFGVDGGATSLNESLVMLASLRSQGARGVFCTPH